VVPTVPSYTDVTLDPANKAVGVYTYNLSEKSYTKTGMPNALLFMVNLTDQTSPNICYTVADSTGHLQFPYNPEKPGCTDYWFIFCPLGDAASNLKSRETCLNSTGINYNSMIYQNPVACTPSPPTAKNYPDHILSHNELYFCNKVTKDYAPLCWPLMLILGLLLGASFAAGKNPFHAFDFSSPRMGRGRQYSARVQNKSFDFLSYIMAAGSTAMSMKGSGKNKEQKAKIADSKGKVKDAKAKLADAKKSGDKAAINTAKANLSAARGGVHSARVGVRQEKRDAKKAARDEKYNVEGHKTGMGKFLHKAGAFLGLGDKKSAERQEAKKDQSNPQSLAPTTPKVADFNDGSKSGSTGQTVSGAQIGNQSNRVNMVVPRQIRQAKRESITDLNKSIKEAKTPEARKALRQEKHALRQDFRSMRQNYGVSQHALEKKGMKVGEDGKLYKDIKEPADKNGKPSPKTQFGFTKSKETVLSILTKSKADEIKKEQDKEKGATMQPGAGTPDATSQQSTMTSTGASQTPDFKRQLPTTGATTGSSMAASMSATDILSVGISMFRRGFWSKEGFASRMKASEVDEFFIAAQKKADSGSNTVGAMLVVLLLFLLKKMMENAKLRDKQKLGQEEDLKVRANLKFTRVNDAVTSLFRIYSVLSVLSSYTKGIGAATGSKTLSRGFMDGINGASIGNIGKYNINVAEIASWVDPSLREQRVGGGLPYPFNYLQSAVTGTVIGGDVLLQKASDLFKRDVRVAFVKDDEAYVAKVDDKGLLVRDNGNIVYEKISTVTGKVENSSVIRPDLKKTQQTYVVVKDGNYTLMEQGAAHRYDNALRGEAGTYMRSNSFVYNLKSKLAPLGLTSLYAIETKMKAFEALNSLQDISRVDGEKALKLIELRNTLISTITTANTFMGIENGRKGTELALNLLKSNQDRSVLQTRLDTYNAEITRFEKIRETRELSDGEKARLLICKNDADIHEMALNIFDAMGSSALDIKKDVFDAANKQIVVNMRVVMDFTNAYISCYSQSLATGNDALLSDISAFRGHGVENLWQDTQMLNTMASTMQNFNEVRFNSPKAEQEYARGLSEMMKAGNAVITVGGSKSWADYSQAMDNLCNTMINGVDFEGRFGNKERDLKKLLGEVEGRLKEINKSHAAGSEKYTYTDATGIAKEIDFGSAVEKCAADLTTVLETSVALHQTSNSYLNSEMAKTGWQDRAPYQSSPESDALHGVRTPSNAHGQRDTRGLYSPTFNLKSYSKAKYAPSAKFEMPVFDWSIEAGAITPEKAEPLPGAKSSGSEPTQEGEPKNAKLDYSRANLTSRANLDEATKQVIDRKERFATAEHEINEQLADNKKTSAVPHPLSETADKVIENFKKNPTEENLQEVERTAGAFKFMSEYISDQKAKKSKSKGK